MTDSDLQAATRWVRANIMAELTGAACAQVGRFDVLRPLGRGGHGQVFLAYDPILDRRVALKLPRRRGSVSSHLREAQACAQVRHPHVVEVYDAGVDEGDLWIAMEWIEGETLRSWMQRPHSRAERQRVLAQAAEGLAALHLAGIVHRDIKPENIMVSREGRAVITDLGVARRLDRTGRVDELVPERVGTRSYRAPEVEAGDEATEAADQFSFFVTAEEVLRPRVGRLRRLVARGLRADPSRRWVSMAEVAGMLEPAGFAPRWVALTPSVVLVAAVLWAMAQKAPERDTASLLQVRDEWAWTEACVKSLEAASFRDVRRSYVSWSTCYDSLSQRPRLAAWFSLLVAELIERSATTPLGRATAAWVTEGAAVAFEKAGAWTEAARCRHRTAERFIAAGDEGQAEKHERCAWVNAGGSRCR